MQACASSAKSSSGYKVRYSSYSSFGPVDEVNHRIKPTLANYGGGEFQGMISLGMDNDYRGTYGTSMSRPATQGVIRLIAEAYQQTNPSADRPTPQFITAVLVNSADDGVAGDNPYPDFKIGFGQVNAQEAVTTVTERRVIEDTLREDGETNRYYFEAADKSDIEVTLAYMDYPGRFLINDLDLKVISPSGKIYHPHAPNAAAPQAVAERRPDKYNNIENIHKKPN